MCFLGWTVTVTEELFYDIVNDYEVKRRKREQELEEQLKVEALRRKEELEERRREELRLQKTPGRSNAVSRNCSPARVPKMVAISQPRSASKVLFPSTPGRVPAKVARVQGDKGECSREPTMNTLSPAQARSNMREKREQLKKHVMEHGEKLRREEQERLRLKHVHEEHYCVQEIKTELDEMPSLGEELRRAEEEETNRLRKEEEDRRRLSDEERTKKKEQEARTLELLEAARKEEERRAEEERQRIREEQKIREQAEAEARERQRAEEEEAKLRLNVSCSAELLNRHLANVSLNTSTAHNRTSPNHSSYEMTPDKTYKPATENDYNIEDLSSGDETDSEPDLTLIFGKKKKYPRRGSSGIWESPISHPRQGVGAYQNRLNKRY
ncbi:hypothetical protein OESDEN_10415 [Oesophagostomum dentatum]|uniref:Inner centromere protein ARK-binding domain-containing protein n=1 Tax=Oesophagostomum dentatum TaxID=61180 RepID=A0A0B1T1U6_OESDE|nr:hypothetical protein OESDEN_10415 [Oesophagostomum dentatum]